MTDASSFTNLVPGFDFLQGLVKNAGAALPVIGQWVAPTIDPAELEKRISELRTVQYWLEQNARMLAATIQALEVQRMTLSTLKTMNVQMGDLAESLKIKTPTPPPAAAQASAPAPAPAEAERSPAPKKKAAPPQLGQAVDPMQWWGALTNQFAQLATHAMKDTANDAAKSLAGSMLKQSFDTAAETMKQVANAPGRSNMGSTSTGGKTARKAAPKRRRSAKATG